MSIVAHPKSQRYTGQTTDVAQGAIEFLQADKMRWCSHRLLTTLSARQRFKGAGFCQAPLYWFWSVALLAAGAARQLSSGLQGEVARFLRAVTSAEGVGDTTAGEDDIEDKRPFFDGRPGLVDHSADASGVS